MANGSVNPILHIPLASQLFVILVVVVDILVLLFFYPVKGFNGGYPGYSVS